MPKSSMPAYWLLILFVFCVNIQSNLGQACPDRISPTSLSVSGCSNNPNFLGTRLFFDTTGSPGSGDACCFVDSTPSNNTCESIRITQIPPGSCFQITGVSQSASDWLYTWDPVNQCQNGVNLPANQSFAVTLPSPTGAGLYEIMYCKDGVINRTAFRFRLVVCCALDITCTASPPNDISCADTAPPFITDINEFDITATDLNDGTDCNSGLRLTIESAVDVPDPTDPMTLACAGPGDIEITRTYTIGSNANPRCIEDVTCTQTYMILADCCCEFMASCQADTDLGTFNCSNLGDIPALPDDIPSVSAPPYGMTIGSNPCGIIVVTSSDSPSIPSNICDLTTDIEITRTIVVFDDIGDGAGGPADGLLNSNEERQECVFTFTIQADVTSPNPICPNDVIANIDCENTTLPQAEVNLSGTDNCGSSSFAVTNVTTDNIPTSFCSSDNLTIERVYTVEDACANEATCTQLFTFAPDVMPPVPTCPVDVVVGIDCTTTVLTPAELTLNGTDNCGTTSFIVTNVTTENIPTSFCSTDDLIIERIYTIEDNCGNSNSCTQMFIIEPDIAEPVPSCPSDVMIGLDCNSTSLPIAETMLTGTDNCGSVNFNVLSVTTDPLPTSFCSTDDLIVERLYAVVDDCQNEGTCVQQFIFTADTSAPSITCPPDINTGLTCGDNTPEITSVAGFIAAMGSILDNCPGDYSISSSVSPIGGISMLNYCSEDDADRTITLMYTISDLCANSSVCTQTIVFESGPIPNAGGW